MQEYTNKNGTKFFITIEDALVPDDADYYGYLFTVLVGNRDNCPGRIYKAMVKKQLCPTKEKAGMWLHTTALDFLKSILETYKDGKTLLLIPATLDWWVI